MSGSITLTISAEASSAALLGMQRAASETARHIAALMDVREEFRNTPVYGMSFVAMTCTAEGLDTEIARETRALDSLLRAAHALHPIDDGTGHPDAYNPERPQLWIYDAQNELRLARDELKRVEEDSDATPEQRSAQRKKAISLGNLGSSFWDASC